MSPHILRWALLCMASTAHAGTLLEKISSPGFVMSSYAIVKKCSISDSGQLVQQYQLNEMASKRTTPLVLTKGSIKIQISEAALGAINTEGMPVDGPTISYRAYQKQAGSTVKTVLLYEENGGIGQKSTNDSPSAVALRNFIDVNCGDPLVY